MPRLTLLAIADRPPRRSILETLAEHPVDLVVTLGDLDYFSLRELEQVTGIPKLGVYGNHCSGTYFADLGIENLHLTARAVAGVTFGGFQGCVRYKQNPDAIMCTQEEASAALLAFPRVDVFLCHCPPRGVNDEEEVAHQGFDGLRDYVLRERPRHLLHGHTYPAAGTLVTRLGETGITYVTSDAIVTLDL